MATSKRILTGEQVHKLRSVCDKNTARGKRDLAILDSMLYQGLRLREIVDLRLEHIRYLGDQVFIYLQHRSNPLRAHTKWLQSLNEWRNQRSVPFARDTGPIFVQVTKAVGDTRKPLGKRTISYLVAKYGNLAGIAPIKGIDRLFPNDLRRTCARNAYDRGARLLSIQALLGFNHLETTARFINVLEMQNPNAAIDLIQYDKE